MKRQKMEGLGGIKGFILGSRRSGSNLLRVMLNGNPDISAPHPPHILHAFHTLCPTYGDLKNYENWKSLLSDAINYCNLNPVPLLTSETNIKLEAVLFYGDLVERSLQGVQDAIYRLIMDDHEASIWVCKSNDNIYYLNSIDTSFGETARYIDLVRDGRDAYNSFLNAPIGPKHSFVAADEWRTIQKRMLEWQKEVGQRLLRVKYEDLITTTRETLERICTFLEISFSEQMLSANTSNEAMRTASGSALWKNVSNPIMRQNSAKYLRLPVDDIWTYESVAGMELENHGYPILFRTPKTFSEEEIIGFRSIDEEMRRLVQQRTSGDGGNRSGQIEFLKKLRNRKGVVQPIGSAICGL